MNITPWRKKDTWLDPFQTLEDIQRDMTRLFDFSYPQELSGKRLIGDRWFPAIDVVDSKDNLTVKAEVPGVSKDEIDVSIHGSTLVIKGEKKKEHEIKEKGLERIERYYGSFYREVELPSEVDARNVKATYKNGVLEMTLPKKEESKPKQISIEVK